MEVQEWLERLDRNNAVTRSNKVYNILFILLNIVKYK